MCNQNITVSLSLHNANFGKTTLPDAMKRVIDDIFKDLVSIEFYSFKKAGKSNPIFTEGSTTTKSNSVNGSHLTPKRMPLLPGARRRGHPPKMTTVLRLWIFLLNSPTSEVRAHCFGMKSYTPSHQHSDQLTLSLDYGRIN